jgi:hypothetical protein
MPPGGDTTSLAQVEGLREQLLEESWVYWGDLSGSKRRGRLRFLLGSGVAQIGMVPE